MSDQHGPDTSVKDLRGLLQMRFPGRYVGNICRKPSRHPLVRDMMYLEGVMSADHEFNDLDLDDLSDDAFLSDSDDEFAPTVAPEDGVIRYRRENPNVPLSHYPPGVKLRLRQMAPNRAVASMLLGPRYVDMDTDDVNEEIQHNWNILLGLLDLVGEPGISGCGHRSSIRGVDDNSMYSSSSSVPSVLRNAGSDSSDSMSSSLSTPEVLKGIQDGGDEGTDICMQRETVIKFAGKRHRSTDTGDNSVTIQMTLEDGGNDRHTVASGSGIIYISSTESTGASPRAPGCRKRRRQKSKSVSKGSGPSPTDPRSSGRLATKTPPIHDGTDYLWSWDA
ncbi:hypothetical protein [Vombatid gammaherpesvirus 1]|uniref:Uncharacterized protein n=1 Tax=Vombatid gammaherpesvirus 1 TaxID=2052651 RepID=A0A3Q8J4E5_9GAMA|nr:hypothetical protein KM710_gp37 [Vombatid gammaherpesvirus 1]AZB49142.1 hypothetical protein [Vombatid gammaherpesvirus 1]